MPGRLPLVRTAISTRLATHARLCCSSSRRLCCSPAPRCSSVRQFHWKTAGSKRFQQRTDIARPSHALVASGFSLLSIASLALVSSLCYFVFHRETPPGPDANVEHFLYEAFATDETDDMSTEIPPGRPGNLTPEQEQKLRQLWVAIFRVCNIDVSGDDEDSVEVGPVESVDGAATKDAKNPGKDKKKKKRGLFRRSKEDSNNTDDAVSATTKAASSVNANAEDDKYNQGKLFHEALASQSPESIRTTIWSMVKYDNPDALVLRFLRARKWDVDKALVMFVSTMHWRSQEMHVDDDIMKNGEGAAVAAEKGTDAQARLSHDFLKQLRSGKSFLHGCDKAGRPICVVRVRLHHQADQIEESLERGTIFIIETCRMLLRPPVDTATIIFDMTGFSMANMDYTPVKFMIKCFEANYPECLGAVLVHKAPWIFQGIWRIIRGWLDPVVANKVHFTNNVNDMEQFIDKEHIEKDLDGTEDWVYKFIEPTPGEDDMMNDTATREKLSAAQSLIHQEYEEATIEWIRNPDGEQGAAIKARRDEIAKRMSEGYWKLDPYIRARSFYDRVGVLKPGGKVDFYPSAEVDDATQTSDPEAIPKTNGNGVAKTSIEDVD